MKKTSVLTLFFCLYAGFLGCVKKEDNIDIVTARMLQVQDTIGLEITHVSPVGKTEGLGETFKVLIGFNQPMVPLQQMQRSANKGPLVIEPPLKGRYQWLGTRTLAFVPDDTISPATKYSVQLIRDRIKSLTGMALARDTAWTFESVRPKLISSVPYQGAQFVDLNSNIYLNFNIEMSPDRIGDKIKLYYTKGMPSKIWCGNMQTEPRFRGEIKFDTRYLKDSEKEDYPLKDWENKRTLVLVPKGNFPAESQIEAVMYPGLLAKPGNLGLEEERILQFNTYNRFSLADYSHTAPGEDALRLCFTNRVNMRELINNIRIEPPVKIPEEYSNSDWDTHEAYLYLAFEPRREYHIRIGKDLKDIYNNRIDKEYRLSFMKGDYTPHVEMPTGINIIESYSDLRFPLNVVNADSVDLQIGRLRIDEAVALLNTPGLFYSNDKYQPSRTGFFSINRYFHTRALEKHLNQQIRVPIELKEALGTDRAGLFFVQMDNLGQTRYNADYRYQKAFLEISDIGVTWKYSPENNLIWTTSLNDTRPISGARVQIRDDKNRVLWEGTTDVSGFCESPGWADLGLGRDETTSDVEQEYGSDEYSYYEEPDLWLTVSTANDAAVYNNKWSFGIDPWRFNISYNWYVQPEEYEAYIFTEKGLYRAGEEINIKGIIRRKKRGQWVLPDVARVKFTVRNSRGEEITSDTILLSQYGSFHSMVKLDQDAPTGVYSTNVALLGKAHNFYETFRVEAYRPAEFEVKISAERDTFVAEETFRALVEGRYLFGLPMKDSEVSWSIRRSYYYINFPDYPGYLFGEYIEGREREILGSGTGRLNNKGEYQVTVKLSRDDIYAPSLLYLEGVVTAPNMTTIAGEQNWVALNANYLIGLKTDRYLYIQGDTVALDIIAIDPSGNKVGGQKARVEIYKTEWKSIKKARLGGRYEWVSEKVETKVDEKRVRFQPDSAVVQLVPDSPGYYFARATGTDNKRRQTSTRLDFYVAGRGAAGWQMRDDDIIELVTDKDEYRVGDTAIVLVKSPYDSAQCLVTVERELVIDKFRKHLQGNADYVKIPIKSNYLPNVYVCVTLLRGRVKDLGWDQDSEQDMGKPQFRIGYVNLTVSADDKQLRILTKPDRSEFRPKDTVTVELTVKDNKNQPAANAEVALFVVDLGVLNLIGFKTPDPFRYFYGSRPLSVRSVESRVNLLGERSYGEKGEERGGGGSYAEGISYRERFISTAFYKADLRTDKHGKGKVRFELPDNLTKFRIMAVAQTQESQFGSAESTLTVNLPFMMNPSIPRFARVGDEFSAGVVLHNRTGKSTKARVECSTKGIEQLESNVKEISLAANSSKEVLFKFRTQTEGEAIFEFKSNIGGETDALRIKIPVSSPPLSEAVALFGSTQDSAVEAIAVPSQVYDNMGGLEVTLSPTILAGMDQGVAFLMEYQYYCLEQLMSKILPLIVGEKLINEFGLSTVAGSALRDTVQSILDVVSEYQKPSGGFVYFKESTYPCPYLSAYTLYVLHRAQKAGYRVDRATVNLGLKFLRDVLQWQDIDWTYPYDDYAQMTTRAFCVYSLALWGEKMDADAARLFESRNQLSIFAKTLLLKAGRILGMGSGFESELARSFINKVKVSPTSAHFEENIARGWTFPSPAKVTASVITTIMELDIPFPYTDAVMRWLVQERGKKTKPTTHENAFVFDAFLNYYERFESEVPDLKATITLGSKQIITQTFKGRTNAKPKSEVVKFNTIPKDTLLPVKISKYGPGRLYYTLLMKYALKEKPYPFDGGFYIWKEIMSLDNKPVRVYRRGEVYKVVLHVVTPETRLFAVVNDPLPAGFVPVQTFFATESQEIRDHYEEAQSEDIGHWWGGFDSQEYYDDRILFFAQELFPGEHTRTYFVRAASEGQFLAPQTKAEEMYAPEVFGTSIQDRIIIE
jgi:uncharacterized protein YfaS (alpha-2-macroglobulin family)